MNIVVRGIGVNPGGWGSRPSDFGVGGRGGVVGLHEILLYATKLKETKLFLFLTARLYSYSCVETQRSTSSGKPEIVHCQSLASFQTLGSGCLEQLVSEHSLRNLTRELQTTA